MDTKQTERGHETLRQILQVLFYLAVAVGVVLLFNSCIVNARDSRDARESEVYEEAYQEGYNKGWYEGQEALIEYVQNDWDMNEKLQPRDR